MTERLKTIEENNEEVIQKAEELSRTPTGVACPSCSYELYFSNNPFLIAGFDRVIDRTAFCVNCRWKGNIKYLRK